MTINLNAAIGRYMTGLAYRANNAPEELSI
jgi:hypothetical protein